MTTQTTATPPEPTMTPPPPDAIMRLASGFMAAKHLFAASELGLFEALAGAPATLDALAARTGLTRRAARISADAMVALGVLDHDGDTYRNSPAAAAYLSGDGPGDLRAFLRFWDKISYPAWCHLTAALGSGPPTEIFELDDPLQHIASEGIEAILAGPANALPDTVDLSAHRRLLDIGGGTGSWSVAIARRYPQLRATVLERRAVAHLTRARIDAAGLTERIGVVVGDATIGELPPGYDVFLLANVVHYWSPEQNRDTFKRIRRTAEPGARLLLADFWTDPTHTQPVQAALMAGEMAVHIRDGDIYSAQEATDWLESTGWRFLDHRTLAGPQSLIMAEATG